MIVATAVALAAASLPSMAWTGRANVYFDGQTIPIGVRTSIASDGTATSESWPEQLGEAKGLRRMIVRSGDGETQVSGTVKPLPADQLHEEQAQFGIYRQIQVASAKAASAAAAGATMTSVDGVTRTWFALRGDAVTGATNWLPVGPGGAMVRQDFTFDGWIVDDGVQFPKHMILKRDGKPYFELWVATFDAR